MDPYIRQTGPGQKGPSVRKPKRPITWVVTASTVLVLAVAGTGVAYAVVARHRDAAEATAEAFGFPLTRRERFEATGQLYNEVEQLVAGCMKRRGREYTPLLTDVAADASRYGYDLTPEEYASKFGFGLAEGLLRTLDAPPSTSASYSATPASGPDLEECRASAPGGLPAVDHKLLEEINAYDGMRNTIESALRSDPEIQRLNDHWSSCMAVRGFTAASEEDLASQQSAKFDSLLGELGTSLIPGPAGAPSLTPEARASLEAFRNSEINAAEAAVACRSALGSSIDDAEARVVLETVGITATP